MKSYSSKKLKFISASRLPPFITALPLMLILAVPTGCNGQAGGKPGGSGLTSNLSSAEKIQVFQSSPQEDLKPTRWDVGNTTISNESRLDLFWDSTKNLGGAYVGVGSTQNFLLASWANAEYIWLMDFTRIVVAANKVHISFLKEAKTPEEFLSLWRSKDRAKVLAVIKKHNEGDPDLPFIISHGYGKARPYLLGRFKLLKFLTEKKRKYKIWLNDQIFYDRLRTLALDGRIRAVKGDLQGPTTLKGIAAAARKMGVPIRIIYYSNAEEYQIFRPYPAKFRENMKALPADAQSLVVRTISKSRWKLPWAPDSKLATPIGFHYNVQPLLQFQEWLRHDPKVSVVTMLKFNSRIFGRTGFSKVIKGPKKTAAPTGDKKQ